MMTLPLLKPHVQPARRLYRVFARHIAFAVLVTVAGLIALSVVMAMFLAGKHDSEARFGALVAVSGSTNDYNPTSTEPSIVIEPHGAATFLYDEAQTRWRLVSLALSNDRLDFSLSTPNVQQTSDTGMMDNLWIHEATSILRVTPLTAKLTITGMSGGQAGRILTVMNDGGFETDVACEDVASVAASRISCPGKTHKAHTPSLPSCSGANVVGNDFVGVITFSWPTRCSLVFATPYVNPPQCMFWSDAATIDVADITATHVGLQPHAVDAWPFAVHYYCAI